MVIYVSFLKLYRRIKKSPHYFIINREDRFKKWHTVYPKKERKL